MHGRPRKAPKPEEAEASATKAANLRSLQSQFLHNHHNKIYTKEALDISAKLLEINPECYTAWNYRKLGVNHHLCKAESDPDSIKSIVNEELRVVERALRQNFKSYGAWHHRKWVLSKGYSSIDDELSLVDKFQKADSRNFHAWNYRRFVAASMNRSEEEELNYTTDMINTSFSNYSAWHNRSVLLSHLLERGVQGFSPKEKVLTDEYDFVHQAIFTEPNDQSGWFYYLWLLHQTIKADTPLLVSSWPAHGSDITLSLDRFPDGHALSSFTSFHSDTGMFPLILYFNQAIEGVNLSTVTVESIFNSNTDLIWRPLSMNISGSSETWVAFLNFLDVKLHSSEAYPVKVSLGHSRGITSSSGFHYNSPSQFSFTVRIQLPNSENVDRQGAEKIFWKDEHFHIYDTQFQESSPVVPFSQLRIKEDLATTNTSKWAVETIASEIKIFQELLTTSDCKIGKLTLARLLMAHDINSEEILELYTVLVKMDPSHSQYYKDEHSLVLLKQATSSMESLLKHCYQYRDSTSTNIWNFTCVRFNNLSLSRVGSVEKLLWVQMLDLSHNELRSIEGLEAMQLLSCLNLSNNKLSSFSALEPLRFLSSLKVLDISYNEIGAHSIDTTRYLCSSPLSHTVDSDWSSGDVQVRKYWEAYLIFRGLKLRQFDVVGNRISDEKFKGFLVKVVHTLKWLDGEELC